MSAAIRNALGCDLCGKLISIEEHHGSDAHFVLSCLMAQDDYATCLVALHHTVGHYQNVSVKLGASLNQRREKNLLETIEPLKVITIVRDKMTIVNDLYSEISKKLLLLCGNSRKQLLIIDDLSDLLSLGVSVRDSYSFFCYCRDLLNKYPGLTIVVLTHIIEEDEESRLLAAGLGHVANIRATVSALPTGRSKDVSGLLTIHDKSPQLRRQHWGQQNKYHYKLLDRQVQLFAPGTSQLL